MDFTAGGTYHAVRFLAQTVPFFNARLQGVYKLGRAGKAEPKRFAAVTGAVALASAMLYLTQADDDDYKALPDWVRDTYWPAKIPGSENFLYIPKPFEVGALGTIVKRGTELAFAGEDYQAKDFAQSVWHVMADQLAMNPIPQAAKPAIEAAFNKDLFRDRPIDSLGQMNLSPGERHTARTSAGAVAAGRALNVSPQHLEHLMSGYFGWLGIQALNAADWLARPMTNLPENPRHDMTVTDNWFVVGDFVKTAQPRTSKYIERFYEQQEKINQLYADLRQAHKIGDTERAQTLATDPRLKLRTTYNHIGNRITDLNQRVRQTERADLPLAEKTARIQTLYNHRAELAKRVDQRARANRQCTFLAPTSCPHKHRNFMQ